MPVKIVNSNAKYSRPPLGAPSKHGYIYIGATVRPGWIPLILPSAERARLIAKLKTLAKTLERVEGVTKVTVFRAVAIPPTYRWNAYLRQRRSSIRIPKFDVVVFVETSSPARAKQIQSTPAYETLMRTLRESARSVNVTLARNERRIGNTNETDEGLFLFNHFVADEPAVGPELWDHLAGWFVTEAGIDNSLLLVPVQGQSSDYSFINEVRSNASLPFLVIRNALKKTFRSYVLANLEANHVAPMPAFYRTA